MSLTTEDIQTIRAVFEEVTDRKITSAIHSLEHKHELQHKVIVDTLIKEIRNSENNLRKEFKIEIASQIAPLSKEIKQIKQNIESLKIYMDTRFRAIDIRFNQRFDQIEDAVNKMVGDIVEETGKLLIERDERITRLEQRCS